MAKTSTSPERTGIMQRFTMRRRIAAAGVVVALIAAGSAYAYWSATGTGSGTTAVSAGGVVTVTATVTDGIVPGGTEPVSFTAANATSAPLTVATIHLLSVTADTLHPTCAVADFTMADVTEAHEVPAGATVEALPTGGTLHYADTGVNQDTCKGATLTLALTTS
jgi:hypothetical protein